MPTPPRRIAQVPWPIPTAGLSPITVESLAWQDDALCREVGGDAWFPDKGGSIRAAKKICDACPVQSDCLEYALENDLGFGIWGGTSERQRRRIRKERSSELEVAA
jgi:WhiB family redox-sensing transcriptional regulator